LSDATDCLRQLLGTGWRSKCDIAFIELLDRSERAADALNRSKSQRLNASAELTILTAQNPWLNGAPEEPDASNHSL
jgi:hypothetical protein